MPTPLMPGNPGNTVASNSGPRNPDKCADFTKQFDEIEAEIKNIESVQSELEGMLSAIEKFCNSSELNELNQMCNNIVITGETFDVDVTENIKGCLNSLSELFNTCNEFLTNEKAAKENDKIYIKGQQDWFCAIIDYDTEE